LNFLVQFLFKTSKSPPKTYFPMLKKLTKFSEKSRIFCPNFVSKLQNHQPKPIFESWTNPRKNWNLFNENSKTGRIWKV